MAFTMTHLLRKLSALFPAFEIALALSYATKLAHAEVWSMLVQREKKWRSRAMDSINLTCASQ